MRLDENVCEQLRTSRAQQEWVGRSSGLPIRVRRDRLPIRVRRDRLLKAHPLLPMTLPVRRVRPSLL